MPFTTQELYQNGSEALYCGLNALSNNLIMVDRKFLKNPNGLILGTPGSGKSFAAKREIANVYLVTNDDIIICDPEAEYGPLVERLHGQVIKISPTSPHFINPMDLNLNYSDDENPLSLKSDFILSLCELIVGGKDGLQPVEKTIIDRCVRLIYRNYLNDPRPENMPVLEDLYHELRRQEEKEAQYVATALEIYVTGSLNVFNHRTNVDIQNRIVAFDIKELGKQLKKIGMLVVQDQVWNRVTINREAHKATRYYIDEFHLLLKEEQTAAYSVEIWKRFRKWGGIPTGITQNVKVRPDRALCKAVYACDRHTADAEFLLAQREYAQLTGRAQDGGVILYQIRQSFKPGEITPEEANRVGYELASRFLKGKHAFFVCTHTDKKHIHNHIYWNAVTLDYKHKFRDFLGSWRAVSRLSDLICLEHQLSVVQNPKRYTHSHYGKWLGNRAKSSHRELARIAIDDALSKHPHTFDAFLDLLQQSGYTVKRGKHLTLCKPGQKNIRFDSLKKEYTEDAIRAVISGKKQRQTREQKPIPAQQNVQKILDLAAIHAANKGFAYERWATNFNTKAASKSLLYLQTVCGGRYDVLTQKADEASAHCRELLDQMNAAQKRLTQIDVLRRHVLNYARTREVFQQYKASGYSKKFLNEHRQEIDRHRAAKRAFNELGLQKLPSKKSLDMEYSQLLAKKKDAYAAYRDAKEQARELLTHRENLRPYLAPQEASPRAKRPEQIER